MSAVEDLAAERNREDEEKPEKRKQADLLVDLAHSSKAELWHTPGSEEAYVTFAVDGHRENWSLRSKMARLWLRRLFYEKFCSSPAAQAVADAIEQLRTEAFFKGEEHEAHLRVGGDGTDIYIDLVNDRWQQVVIRQAGAWEVISGAISPIRFRRTKGMLSLPTPVRGGDLVELRKFINLKRDEDWILFVVFLLCCLRSGLPFWLLVLVGEQGTGKSTCAELIRSLTDPNKVPLRSRPRDERELAIAAKNGWLLCFDNMSGLEAWLADALCRLVSGAGFSTRTLYENDEEELFEGRRPVVLNGIADLLGRPDLADRAISITLSEIKESDRRDEAKLREEFRAAAPRSLGAIYSTMAAALSHLPAVRSTATALPRMADVHLLGLAVERAMKWPSGTFQKAYRNNRREIIGQTLDADPCALAVRAWFEDRKRRKWKGTASELLRELDEFAPDGTKQGSKWPRTGSSLSGHLRRAAPFLRSVGIEVVLPRKSTKGKRVMRIHRTVPQKSATAATPATERDPRSAAGPEGRSAPHSQNGAGGAGWRSETGSATQKDAADQSHGAMGGAGGASAQPSSSPSTTNPTKHPTAAVDGATGGNVDQHVPGNGAAGDKWFAIQGARHSAASDRAEAQRLRHLGSEVEARAYEKSAAEHEERASSLEEAEPGADIP